MATTKKKAAPKVDAPLSKTGRRHNFITNFGDKRNSKPFKKGQSGNPKGRPPLGKSIADILRSVGDEPASEQMLHTLDQWYPKINKTGMTRRQVMLHRVHIDSELGLTNARDFVAERTEGKVRDYLDITTNDKDINSPVAELNLAALTPEKILALRAIVRESIRAKKPDAPVGTNGNDDSSAN